MKWSSQPTSDLPSLSAFQVHILTSVIKWYSKFLFDNWWQRGSKKIRINDKGDIHVQLGSVDKGWEERMQDSRIERDWNLEQQHEVQKLVE
jgi:hypothetical protein